jgi:hypothetical protein
MGGSGSILPGNVELVQADKETMVKHCTFIVSTKMHAAQHPL